ncbi:MAG: hypothetical protein ACREKL_08395 [Chthoniobacterales bacterium]
MSTCILVSTCDKYRPLADFTRARIGEFWKDAPPMRLCGIADEANALPLRDDPRNWMKITRSACDDLMAEGFTQAYVILDDHPPLGTCHATHLNETLPAMMRELGAVSIALSGWGQGREPMGGAVHWRDWELDHCQKKNLWKFPLHPALWRLDALRRILDYLITTLPESEHTPWAFERKGGASDSGLPDELTTLSYRIEGRSKAAKKFPTKFDWLKYSTDLYRYAVRMIGGDRARTALDERILGVHHYYHGPYPLIWSGLMRKGRINPNALFLFAVGRRDDWIEVLESMSFE